VLRIVLRRLLWAVPLVLGVSLVVFLLASLVPGDPARTILGESATPEAVAALRTSLGLDRPWYEQYLSWLGGLAHGDLGTSVFTGEPVTAALNDRLAVTLALVLTTVVVSTVVGVATGMVGALRGGATARVLDVVSLAGIALPSFWVALVLISLFAVKLRWFPATGYVSPDQSLGGWASSLVLPVVSLGLLGISIIAKQTRDAAMTVLDGDHVAVLRANGLPETRLVLGHVLRNASIPVVSAIGVVFVGSLDATVFVENVFVLPGLGSRATQATVDHDVSVILGIGVYFTLVVVLVNLLVDVAYGLLDPKVRAA
jgi:peptide/nickel transport system permease protein